MGLDTKRFFIFLSHSSFSCFSSPCASQALQSVVDLGFQNNRPPFQRVSVHRFPVFYSPLNLCPCRDPRHASSCELDSVCFVMSISRKLGRTVCAPQLIFNSSPDLGCTNGQLVQSDIPICNLCRNLVSFHKPNYLSRRKIV